MTALPGGRRGPGLGGLRHRRDLNKEMELSRVGRAERCAGLGGSTRSTAAEVCVHVGTGPAGAARGAHRTPRGTAVPAAPCVHVHARTCDPRPFSAHARSVHTHVPFRTRAADARTDAPAAHARDSRALARCDGAWPGRKWAWPPAEGRGLQEVGVAPPRSDSNLKHELSRPKLFPRRADVSPAGPRAANGRSRRPARPRRHLPRRPQPWSARPPASRCCCRRPSSWSGGSGATGSPRAWRRPNTGTPRRAPRGPARPGAAAGERRAGGASPPPGAGPGADGPRAPAGRCTTRWRSTGTGGGAERGAGPGRAPLC